jgi:TrmH family RNA methyltransferase
VGVPDLVISSVANPLIKRIRALARGGRRQEEDLFYVEGIRAVWQAVERDVPLAMLILAPDLLTSEPARRMLAAQEAAGRRVVRVSGAVFKSFAAREHPSGLAALVPVFHATLADLPIGPGALFVALHEPGNPGNLGTILRTLDAVGGSGLITIGAATDPYHPTAVKASMGALFTVPVIPVARWEPVSTWCRARGIGVVTTSSHAARVDHWSARYPDPCLLLFGSEGHGLPDVAVGAGDLAVRIPMSGAVDSLNLAVAAGILLYEVRRSRRDVVDG